MPAARQAPIELGRYVLVPSRRVQAMLENTSARRERVPVAQARSVLNDAFRSPSARTRIFEAYRGAEPSRHVSGATRQALADALAWVLRAVSMREPEYVLLRQAPPTASGELPFPVIELPPSREPDKRHYVDLLLVDQNGEPVPGGPYTLQLPDGEQRKGTLGALGAAYVTTSAAGNARFEMPDRVLDDDKRGVVELELKTPDGRPAAHIAFELKGSDGKVVRGVTDEAGRAVASGLPDGDAELSFPDLDESAWRRGTPSEAQA